MIILLASTPSPSIPPLPTLGGVAQEYTEENEEEQDGPKEKKEVAPPTTAATAPPSTLANPPRPLHRSLTYMYDTNSGSRSSTQNASSGIAQMAFQGNSSTGSAKRPRAEEGGEEMYNTNNQQAEGGNAFSNPSPTNQDTELMEILSDFLPRDLSPVEHVNYSQNLTHSGLVSPRDFFTTSPNALFFPQQKKGGGRGEGGGL